MYAGLYTEILPGGGGGGGGAMPPLNTARSYVHCPPGLKGNMYMHVCGVGVATMLALCPRTQGKHVHVCVWSGCGYDASIVPQDSRETCTCMCVEWVWLRC